MQFRKPGQCLILLILAGCYLIQNRSYGQTPGFIIPDTVCANSIVPLTNNITTATSYYWNFCSGNLGTNPTGTNVGNPWSLFDIPVNSQLIKQGNDHFLFLGATNSLASGNGNVFRYFLGNSFSNAPISYTALPNSLINYNAETFRVYKNTDGVYYGFLTNGVDHTLLRYHFGTDLWNTPTVTDLGNIGGVQFSIWA